MIREPYSAFFSECVTCIIVTPSSLFIFRKSSMISSPCFELRFPVGSSANNNFGLPTKALQIPINSVVRPTIELETDPSYQLFENDQAYLKQLLFFPKISYPGKAKEFRYSHKQ